MAVTAVSLVATVGMALLLAYVAHLWNERSEKKYTEWRERW